MALVCNFIVRVVLDTVLELNMRHDGLGFKQTVTVENFALNDLGEIACHKIPSLQRCLQQSTHKTKQIPIIKYSF